MSLIGRQAGPRILIVDDDPVLLDSLSGMLEIRLPEAAVETSASAAAAVERLDSREFDIVISDIKMPHMDGLALMRHVHAHQPGIPILLVTGHGDHALAVESVTGGAYAFIPKPIDREYFFAWLKRAWHERRLSQEVDYKTRALELYARDLAQMVEERTAALQDSEQRFRVILDHAPMSIAIKDVEGRYVFVNRRAAAVLHAASDQVVGKTDYDFWAHEVAERLRANDQRALETGTVIRVDESFCAAGSGRYVSMKIPLATASGALYGVCGISADSALLDVRDSPDRLPVDGSGGSTPVASDTKTRTRTDS